MPFSHRCDCCLYCRACPCRAGTTPLSLSAIFNDWTSSPDGYCSNCDIVNGTFEIPGVENFNIGTAIGDAYGLTSPRVPCVIALPGEGCRFEADYLLDCVPQACLDECTGACNDECTADSDCDRENCATHSCAGNFLCGGYGPTCAVECEQESVCVFDEELDPMHEHGSCAAVGDCASSVVPDTCPPVKLRVRAMLYVSDDLTPVLAVFVALFSRHLSGEAAATLLRGWHEFAPGTLDCGEIDMEVDLEPLPDYLQPPVPACGMPTSVRMVSVM